jgi:hypothetical protein
MYMGTGGRGVANSPSVMFAHQVDCVGCHITPTIAPEDVAFKGQTFKTTAKSCSACHDESYEGILDSWKEELAKSLSELEPKLTRAGNLITASGRKNGQALALYNDAKYNYYFVRDAKGAHNIDYATALLKKADENLERTLTLLK